MLKFAADHLFTGTQLLDHDHILVVNDMGTVESILPRAKAGEDIQQLHGVLSPGFINAHCHLELSHLEGLIKEGGGLVRFLTEIIRLRQGFSQEDISEAMEKAEQQMWENGITAVGDICNTRESLPVKLKRKLYYHSFVETSGFTEHNAAQHLVRAGQLYKEFRQGELAVSIVPHAPYSVSRSLLTRIAELTENTPLSIHNQETDAENELYRNKSGEFFSLYQTLGIDPGFFKATGQSSLASYLPWITPKAKLILVHNTYTSTEDLRFAKQSGHDLYWCLCPNANLYIEGCLPDIPLFREADCKIVLGTDSLASNHQLSILEEMKTISRHFPAIPMFEILKWATLNGAEALGVSDKFGSFERGKRPGVLLLENGVDTMLSEISTVRRIF